MTKLDFIFGEESSGKTVEERAKTSTKRYVRSQDQIAEFNEGEPTGRVLTAWEVLKAFGEDILKRVAKNSSTSLVRERDEPAATLKLRREQLRLSVDDLKTLAGLETQEIEGAEDSKTRTSIRKLERICQVMGLDERLISWEPNAGGDEKLAFRFKDDSLPINLDSHLVGRISEATWIIATQDRLQIGRPRWKPHGKHLSRPPTTGGEIIPPGSMDIFWLKKPAKN